MAGSINIGAMRDFITISYELAVVSTVMGGRVQTFSPYEVPADVRPLSSSVAMKYGMDAMSDSYMVHLRPPAEGRPVKLVYEGVTYRVVSSERDKLNQFLTLIVTADR